MISDFTERTGVVAATVFPKAFTDAEIDVIGVVRNDIVVLGGGVRRLAIQETAEGILVAIRYLVSLE